MAAREKVATKASASKTRAKVVSQSRTKPGKARTKDSGRQAGVAKKSASGDKVSSKVTAGAKEVKRVEKSQPAKKPVAKERAAPKSAVRPLAKPAREKPPVAPIAKAVVKEVAGTAIPVANDRGAKPAVASKPAPATPAAVKTEAPAAAAGPTGIKAVGADARKPEPVAVTSGAAPVSNKLQKAPSSSKSPDRDSTGGETKTMRNNTPKHGFKLNEFVVYPAHGVGQIVAIDEEEVAGFKLELFVINFVKDKMTLRVPTSKVTGVGMRKLSDAEGVRRSLEILTGRARIKRTMWSRRAQEYEAKINSGDIYAIAEVVRDLFRSEAQPEQSYSERQLYEAALDRMMREVSAVQKLSETEALKLIDTHLRKNTKRGKAEGGEGDAEDAGIEEAA